MGMRIAIVLALIGSLACGSASPQAGATASAPATAAATAAPAPTGPLTVIQGNNIDTLDPHTNTRAEGFSVLVNIEEGLIGRDPQTMRPAPALATSWSQPDANTWVFKLRTGVTFHNGEPFNAAAAKYNLDRVLDPATKSAAGAALQPLVSKIEAVDEGTLRITTKLPVPFLLERMARLYFIPPKESAQKGDEWIAKNPVGTGPYKLVSWVTGQGITLTRNDSYWGAKPAYKDVKFRQILEPATAIAELLAGSADILESIPPDQVSAVKNAGASVIGTQTQLLWEVGFDALARGGPTPFTDVRVRQAANMAVDRDAIAKTILGGYSKPVASFLGPLHFGFDASLQPYPFDQAKAKQLLAQAGYPNGFETLLTVYPISAAIDHVAIVQAIASDLAKVGIKAQIRQITISEATTLSAAGKNGPMILRGVQCAGAFDAALCTSFLSKTYSGSYYNSDELEGLFTKAGSAIDPAERQKLYAQAQKLVFDQAASLFGWTGFYLSAVGKKVTFPPSGDAQTRVFLATPK